MNSAKTNGEKKMKLSKAQKDLLWDTVNTVSNGVRPEWYNKKTVNWLIDNGIVCISKVYSERLMTRYNALKITDYGMSVYDSVDW
jgi:hypothetical protein